MPPARLFPELHDRDWLADAYARHGSLRGVAGEIGCCLTAAANAFIKFAIPRRKEGWATIDDPRVHSEAWLANALRTHTAVDVAAHLKVAPITIYRAARKFGIKLQPGKRRALRVTSQ